MSMFNDVGVWCMHFSGSVKQYMCHKRLLGVYQCLSECVSVSNMLPRDICQYLIGLGCEGRVSKRRRIFSLTLWLFSRWQILAGCLATNTLYRTVTSGWHVPETSITFESICASIENLDFKCAKVRTRKLPDKIPHSHKPQPRIIRMELHALLPHKHLVARSLLRPASMSEPEPPMLRRSLTPPASGPHGGPVYPRLPLNPEPRGLRKGPTVAPLRYFPWQWVENLSFAPGYLWLQPFLFCFMYGIDHEKGCTRWPTFLVARLNIWGFQTSQH